MWGAVVEWPHRERVVSNSNSSHTGGIVLYHFSRDELFSLIPKATVPG